MIKPFLLFSSALIALLSIGCVTREDIRGIQTDLFTIQQGLEKKLGSVEDQTSTVQTSQADLATNMAELSDTIAALNEELQDSRNRVDKIAARLDDLEAALVARMDAMIELLAGSKFTEKPLPSTIYALANGDYVRGRIPDAIKGFRKYIEMFPKSEKVPDARIKIGEGYVKQKQWTRAHQTFNEFIKANPNHRLVPTVMLKKGNAYEAQGEVNFAKRIYTELINKYPRRPEAKRAKQSLQYLKTLSR